LRLSSLVYLAVAFVLLFADPGWPQPVRRVPASLYDAVKRDGPIRVIVRIAPPARTFPSAAQDKVLAELAGSRHRVIHRYANSPVLALEVGEDALRALDRSPHVQSVAADFAKRPAAPGTRP
jgi:hypothetical protein